MKRPAKSKTSASKKSSKAKRSATSKGSARRKSAAKVKKSVRAKASAKKQPSSQAKKPAAPDRGLSVIGPKLAANEKGVHIIFVRDAAVACVSHADPTAHELQQLANGLPRVPAMTDVVVFGGKPYQFAGGALRKHPQVHTQFPDSVLVLHGSTGDSAAWWSEEPFTITGIKEDPIPGRPQNPGPAPYPFSQEPVTRPESGGIYVARSTATVPGSYGHQYKIKFTMGGREIDPHMDSQP